MNTSGKNQLIKIEVIYSLEDVIHELSKIYEQNKQVPKKKTEKNCLTSI